MMKPLYKNKKKKKSFESRSKTWSSFRYVPIIEKLEMFIFTCFGSWVLSQRNLSVNVGLLLAGAAFNVQIYFLALVNKARAPWQLLRAGSGGGGGGTRVPPAEATEQFLHLSLFLSSNLEGYFKMLLSGSFIRCCIKLQTCEWGVSQRKPCSLNR